MTTATKPRFEIDETYWLFAKTHEIHGREGLIVYRSPIARDRGRVYAPVRGLLEEHDHQLVARAEVTDETMMSTRAELTLYALGTGPAAADFVDELWAECGRSIHFADGLPR